MLFSEPKIPQSDRRSPTPRASSVSVLFSEPKIPQLQCCSPRRPRGSGFSALQRAENSSIYLENNFGNKQHKFQCSSASRKFLNSIPKRLAASRRPRFSALQRAENSSIQTLAPASIHISDRDDHASSFLSLPGASP